jgi:hypothetical protein
MYSSLVFAENWQIRQVKINHIQAGIANVVWMTISGNVKDRSGCSSQWGDNWVAIPLDSMTELKKQIINMATVAHTSGQLVDFGGRLVLSLRGLSSENISNL